MWGWGFLFQKLGRRLKVKKTIPEQAKLPEPLPNQKAQSFVLRERERESDNMIKQKITISVHDVKRILGQVCINFDAFGKRD